MTAPHARTSHECMRPHICAVRCALSPSPCTIPRLRCKPTAPPQKLVARPPVHKNGLSLARRHRTHEFNLNCTHAPAGQLSRPYSARNAHGHLCRRTTSQARAHLPTEDLRRRRRGAKGSPQGVRRQAQDKAWGDRLNTRRQAKTAVLHTQHNAASNYSIHILPDT